MSRMCAYCGFCDLDVLFGPGLAIVNAGNMSIIAC